MKSPLFNKWKNRSNKFLERLKAPLVRISKKIVLPGFEGISLYEVSTFFIRGILKNSINLRASAISFDFIMALAPTILFFFTLIPYLPIPNLHDTIMGTLHSALPENAFLTVRSTIEDVISHTQRELLSIGFLLTIYFASNGMISIIRAFNQSVLVSETRSNLKIRLVSIFLVMVVAIIIIIASGLQVGSNWVINTISERFEIPGFLFKLLVFVIKYSIFLLLLFSVFSFIYYLAPAKRGMYRFVSPGSTLATIASIITVQVFSFFINNFGHYNKLYGSLGTLIVIFLLVNLTSMILLIGFELNASIYKAKTTEETEEGPGAVNA
jgi:membrane protein